MLLRSAHFVQRVRLQGGSFRGRGRVHGPENPHQIHLIWMEQVAAAVPLPPAHQLLRWRIVIPHLALLAIRHRPVVPIGRILALRLGHVGPGPVGVGNAARQAEEVGVSPQVHERLHRPVGDERVAGQPRAESDVQLQPLHNKCDDRRGQHDEEGDGKRDGEVSFGGPGHRERVSPRRGEPPLAARASDGVAFLLVAACGRAGPRVRGCGRICPFGMFGRRRGGAFHPSYINRSFDLSADGNAFLFAIGRRSRAMDGILQGRRVDAFDPFDAILDQRESRMFHRTFGECRADALGDRREGDLYAALLPTNAVGGGKGNCCRLIIVVAPLVLRLRCNRFIRAGARVT
mmetsp:Transcript_325/g.763  ORF Transcript_325/g.763 Transcript_325/m.763 type:complete len:346 (-) Transcript_325:196-1233(-)